MKHSKVDFRALYEAAVSDAYYSVVSNILHKEGQEGGAWDIAVHKINDLTCALAHGRLALSARLYKLQ